MDSSDVSSSQHIILSDEEVRIPALDGRTFIVKLNNAEIGHNPSQIFSKYVPTSIGSSEKANDEAETEIAFEIIQEPLLNDSVVVENRLFFDPDYALDKTIHQQKDGLQTVLIEKNKDESPMMQYEGNQGPSTIDHSVNEIVVNENIGEKNSIELDAVSTSYAITSSCQTETSLCSGEDVTVKFESPDPEDNQKEEKTSSDVIKKTMVEAFVKMIVCRKITVQKKDAKTGDILDVDIKMEEEEPVVLDVDYVETTEDAISGQVSKHSTDSFKTNIAAACSGLKVLGTDSDTGQKIGKSLFSTSLFQSTLQKGISKAMQSDVISSKVNENSDIKPKSGSRIGLAKNISSESDSEMMEALNDDSEDYTPYSNSKARQQERKRKRPLNLRDGKTPSKSFQNNKSVEKGIVKTEQGDSYIVIPKKRGRKKRWDKTIGLALNMKTCQFCNKQFDSVVSCSKHMRKGDCVSAQFCFICSKTFDSEKQLEIHISSHRNENKRSSYNCDDCRRSYRTKAGFVKHFRMGTCKKREGFEDGETGDFTCDLCDSRFSTLDYLQLHHYKVHENPEDRHICPDCGKTFYSLQGFQRHRSGRPCTEPLKCHICGKTYKAKESFKLHMKHHKSEITGFTYNCDECGRSYMTEAALTKHKLLHTGVKPYKCEICGKDFAMRYQVKDHARMHSGEKPYSCKLCGVSFSNKGHLGRHIRSHENGTLLRRGRPKKIPESDSLDREDAEIKPGQTIRTIDGQTIQVIDGKLFNNQGEGPPMIIQADTNTIIIAERWSDNSIPVSHIAPIDENISIVT